VSIDIPEAKQITNLASFQDSSSFSTNYILANVYNNVSQVYVTGNYNPAMLSFIQNFGSYQQAELTLPTQGALITLATDVNSSNVYVVTSYADNFTGNGGQLWTIDTSSMSINSVVNFTLPKISSNFELFEPSVYNPMQDLVYLVASNAEGQPIYVSINPATGHAVHKAKFTITSVPQRIFFTGDYFLEFGDFGSSINPAAQFRNWRTGDVTYVGSAGCNETSYSDLYLGDIAVDYTTNIAYGIIKCSGNDNFLWSLFLNNGSTGPLVQNNALWIIDGLAFSQ